MDATWRRTLVLAMASIALVTVLAPGGTASVNGQQDLASVRAATEKYHDVGVAEAARYHRLLDCFDSGNGGMGQHYVQVDNLDATIDPLDPEAMVYQVRDNRLQLVAVEYIVPQSKWERSEPPMLFGQTFHRNDALGLWVLHAWIWRPNPDGMFADFNPSVPPCPSA